MSNPLDLAKPMIQIEYEGRIIQTHDVNEKYKATSPDEMFPILFGTEQTGTLIIKHTTAYEYLITILEFADPAIILDEYDPHILPQKEKRIKFTLLTESARKRPVNTRIKLDGGYTI